MGKRSNFKRNPRDYYKTPEKAVKPLLPFIIDKGLCFSEPCAGDGSLVRHLVKHGLQCGQQSDIEPQNENITKIDARDLSALGGSVNIIITNQHCS